MEYAVDDWGIAAMARKMGKTEDAEDVYKRQKKKIEDNYALFDVPFVGGENLLEAVAVAGDSKLRDMLRIQFQLVGSQLKDEAIPFTEINVMRCV